LLAPQRGLIAIVKSRTRDLSTISSALSDFRHPLLPCCLQAAYIEPCILLELSNFYCLPGRTGGLPVGLAGVLHGIFFEDVLLAVGDSDLRSWDGAVCVEANLDRTQCRYDPHRSDRTVDARRVLAVRFVG
jgi:hypothetical protein